MRSKFKVCGNPEYAEVSVDKVLCNGHWSSMFGSPTSRSKPVFIDDMMKIPGVTEVSVSKYSVTLQKGDVFEWDEIHPKITEILEKFEGVK